MVNIVKTAVKFWHGRPWLYLPVVLKDVSNCQNKGDVPHVVAEPELDWQHHSKLQNSYPFACVSSSGQL